MANRREAGVKIRASEKDQLIADLRQQLFDLRNQDRDYRGVNDEIFAMENRYRMLSDDKARSEHDHRLKLDRAVDDIQNARRQLEELKYHLSEKTKQNCDLSDEVSRCKRVLDEKYFEATRLREESVAKGDQVADLRKQQDLIETEIEQVKCQRAEMWREISKLKEMCDQKVLEANHQTEKQKCLNHELQRVSSRIEDTQKLIDLRSHDLRAKQVALDETERELARVNDHNAKIGSENAALRRDNERVQSENHDLKREVEFQETRNGDCAIQLREAEMRLKEKEEALFVTRKDSECQQAIFHQNQRCHEDLLHEKDALERHAHVLQVQNEDLTNELDRFVQSDEQLRAQLDRRARVDAMQSRQHGEVRHSANKVQEARSRSPPKYAQHPLRNP